MVGRVLRRHIWSYSVCLCPIKRTLGLYGLRHFAFAQLAMQKFTIGKRNSDGGGTVYVRVIGLKTGL